MAIADTQVIEGRSFRRWTGDVPAGGTLSLVLPGTRRTPQLLLLVVAGLMTLVLGIAGWYGIRTHRRVGPATSPEELVYAIASLDARFLDRHAETSAAEWAAYQKRRSQLKAQLESSLAARRGIP
jgi:hypothetical protein